MTIMEALVAVLIFSVVFLTALALFQSANRAYLQTDAATIQQQNIRFGMDRMLETVRDSGAGHNALGSKRLADEQIEGAWESALFVRGNFDNARETSLESTTFPIVTTGNDEIVGYVLLKNGTGTVGIDITADLTGASNKRDAIYTDDDTITGEEVARVAVAATDVAGQTTGQTNPPYQLARVTFDAAGNPQYQILAENIFRMKFEYLPATTETAVIADGSNDGSANDERAERRAVRRIKIKLIGMADRPDFGYVDPWAYGADYADMQNPVAARSYRKFAVQATVFASNLGITGNSHDLVPTLNLPAPTYITACTGHCRSYFLRWPASSEPGISEYRVRVTAPAQAPAPAHTEDLIVTNALETYYTQPAIDFANSLTRAFSFQVAPVSSGILGTWGPIVQLAAANPDPGSKPNAPTNITGTAASGVYAMQLSWTPVTTNVGTLTATSLCNSAGSVSGGSEPPWPWNTQAYDLREYKVYREISKNGNTGASATTEVTTDVWETTFVNTSPGKASTPFIDNTAAPCTDYWYRVKACDTCDLHSDFSAALSNAIQYPISDTSVRPAKPTKPRPVGAVVSSGGNNSVLLEWDPVKTTEGGRPARTAHFAVRRERKVGTGMWEADTTTHVYEAQQLPTADVSPQTVGGTATAYRYYVDARYDCTVANGGARVHTSDPYYLACTPPATHYATISTPPSGAIISQPVESAPNVVVTMTGGGRTYWAGAELTISGDGGTVGPITISGQPDASMQYTFTGTAGWDESLGPGEYTISVSVDTATGGCKALATRTVLVETSTCGLRVVTGTPTLLPNAGPQADRRKQLQFQVENNCDAPITIDALSLTWFDGPPGASTATISQIQYASTARTATNLTAANGSQVAFTTGGAVTIPANGTSSNFLVFFSAQMDDGVTGPTHETTWRSIIARLVTTPVVNDEMVETPFTP